MEMHRRQCPGETSGIQGMMGTHQSKKEGGSQEASQAQMPENLPGCSGDGK